MNTEETTDWLDTARERLYQELKTVNAPRIIYAIENLISAKIVDNEVRNGKT